MNLKNAIARRGVLGGALFAALAGCAAGPDFRSPAAPPVDGYRKDPLPVATAETQAPTGDAQRFVGGADVPGQWWTAFANEELSRRIAQALDVPARGTRLVAEMRAAMPRTLISPRKSRRYICGSSSARW